ncbi:hypothetical protein MIR68_006648 [Amoeboaphelidium protococcarum]|nr:hypothetical protein MIR68_006648 [Amoeboaphelidium protococcarum]
MQKIGEGAFGSVLCVMNGETQIALKCMKINDCKCNDILKMVQEIKLMKSLSHQNIVMMHAASYSSELEQIEIQMELMDMDLQQYIQRGLQFIQINQIVQDILQGLNYLHHNLIIHRDIKPANILINQSGEVKICDFGLCRMAQQSGEHPGRFLQIENSYLPTERDTKQPLFTEYCATRWYRAPELLLSYKYYTEAIDLWALGCIIFELVYRTPLFPGNDNKHQLHLIVQQCGAVSDSMKQCIQNPKVHQFIHTLLSQFQPYPHSSRQLDKADTNLSQVYTGLLQLDPLKRLSAIDAYEILSGHALNVKEYSRSVYDDTWIQQIQTNDQLLAELYRECNYQSGINHNGVKQKRDSQLRIDVSLNQRSSPSLTPKRQRSPWDIESNREWLTAVSSPSPVSEPSLSPDFEGSDL